MRLRTLFLLCLLAPAMALAGTLPSSGNSPAGQVPEPTTPAPCLNAPIPSPDLADVAPTAANTPQTPEDQSPQAEPASADALATAPAPAAATSAPEPSKQAGFFSRLVDSLGELAIGEPAGDSGSTRHQSNALNDKSMVIALLLAFFLGWLGLHRVYLGGTPWLILFYFFLFGLFLSLIDFIFIIIDGDLYVNSDYWLAFIEAVDVGALFGSY